MDHVRACSASESAIQLKNSRAAVERMDAQLAQRARAETALRLHLGQVLEVLGRGGCFELGFSSLSAYALERCERSVRWALGARCLAQRLEALPALRQGVAAGRVSWSKAELLVHVASPGDEARWVDAARRLTVRQLRALLKQEASSGREDAASASLADGDELCTLVCTVDREEAWLFEATRSLLDQLGMHGADAQLQALLAETQVTLLDAVPRGAIDVEAETAVDVASAEWRKQLDRWRKKAEARCEANIQETLETPLMNERVRASSTRSRAEPRGAGASDGIAIMSTVACAARLGVSVLEQRTARELDGIVRALCRALARHEVDLSRLILEFHRADGWRRMGYATETQYARERLGMSRSSMLARRALALRLAPSSGAAASTHPGLPLVAEALSRADIGVEAALQLVRVATAETERAWVERAQRRTIKHLREEVAAALTAQRITGEADCPPPAVSDIDGFHELERAASSGRVWRPVPAPAKGGSSDGVWVEPSHASCLGEPTSAGRAWRVTLDSLTEWLAGSVQTSAARTVPSAGVQTSAVQGERRGAGRVVLRLRVARGTRAWWRGLESQARRWLPRGMSWLRFCCLSLWGAWRHLLEPEVAYGHIYILDRQRCTSPVCQRRDVTPHHLQFRSQGGGDEDENVAAVCTWCHLLGIHGGRIRAQGTASHIRWELGRRDAPCLVVHGRERQVA